MANVAALKALHTDVDVLMCEIAKLFTPGTKLTLLARQPSHPDGSRDALFTDDNLPSAIKAMELKWSKSEHVFVGAAPVRLQRSRAKGERLVSPNGLPVVCVTRGTKWGNPYRIADVSQCLPDGERRRVAVEWFSKALITGSLQVTIGDARRELRGKNLACWCPIGEICHADLLLEVANG